MAVLSGALASAHEQNSRQMPATCGDGARTRANDMVQFDRGERRPVGHSDAVVPRPTVSLRGPLSLDALNGLVSPPG